MGIAKFLLLRSAFNLIAIISQLFLCEKHFRRRPHVSGYFLIRKFSFPDTASVHTHPANSAANPEIFESALQSGKKKSATNPVTCGRGIRKLSNPMT